MKNEMLFSAPLYVIVDLERACLLEFCLQFKLYVASEYDIAKQGTKQYNKYD